MSYIICDFLFQFLIGAIGRVACCNISRIFAGFNSLLVRLEVAVRGGNRVRHRGFNSLLVRLEVVDTLLRGQVFPVSIPYWCDWKRIEPERINYVLKFQFLIGAIGSPVTSLKRSCIVRFNSLLVRLEVDFVQN